MKNLLLLSLILLAGCSSNLDIQAAPVTLPPPPKPQIQAMTMKSVTWKLITKDDIPALEAQIKANPTGFVLYALDTNNFQNLGNNLEEVRRYIKEQGAVIIYYQDLSTSSNTDSDKSKTSTKDSTSENN